MDAKHQALEALADESTAGHRLYLDVGAKAAAQNLAVLLRNFAKRDRLPDDSVLSTFLGAAEKLLAHSSSYN